MWRAMRRWTTARVSDAAVAAAPLLPRVAVDAVEWSLRTAGPFVPILRGIVAGNMRAAGVFEPRHVREYFARCAAHLAGALHVFRLAGHTETHGASPSMPDELTRIVEQRIRLDDSIDRLRDALALGRGAVILPAHTTNYLLALARVNQVVPITIYLRHSRNPRRLAAKRRWCEATGLHYIAEPASATDPTSRAVLMADALREGRALVITPDLPQKRGSGAAVRLLNRTIFLPTGGAGLALLADAPLLAATNRAEGPANRVCFHGPYDVPDPPRGRGWRPQAIQRRLQWFADIMSDFLRTDPALWFLWADNRWTRVFLDDPRYTGRPDEGGAPGGGADAKPADAAANFEDTAD